MVLLLFLGWLLENRKDSALNNDSSLNGIFKTWIRKWLLYYEGVQLPRYLGFLDTYTPGSGVRPSQYFTEVKTKLWLLTTFSSPSQLLLHCPEVGELCSLLISLPLASKAMLLFLDWQNLAALCRLSNESGVQSPITSVWRCLYRV